MLGQDGQSVVLDGEDWDIQGFDKSVVLDGEQFNVLGFYEISSGGDKQSNTFIKQERERPSSRVQWFAVIPSGRAGKVAADIIWNKGYAQLRPMVRNDSEWTGGQTTSS